MKPQEKSVLIESLALLIAWLILTWLSQGLADADKIGGLNGRYVQDLLNSNHRLPANYAMWLADHVSYVWGMFSLAIFATINLGRCALAPGAIVCLNLSIWTMTGISIQTIDTSFLSISFALGTLFLMPLASRWTSKIWQSPQQCAQPFIVPGLVLFAGLGWLILLDYSARAHYQLRFLANHQIEAIFYGLAICCTIAGIKPSLFAYTTRALARIDHYHAKGSNTLAAYRDLIVLLSLNLCWSLLLIGLFGKKSPSLTSELLRLPAYLLSAWIICRWGNEERQWKRMLLLSTIELVVVSTGFLGTHDDGQLLLIMLTISVLFGVLVTAWCRRSQFAHLLGIASSFACLFEIHHLLIQYGGDYSVTLGQRIFAMKNLGTGALEFLSENNWFLRSTPLFGHGLGKVPYCGTFASLEIGAGCGIAKQSQSDYFFILLTGVVGPSFAVLIVGLIAMWLLQMLPKNIKASSTPDQQFAYWVICIFVAISLTQLFYTCLGSLGIVVLTGITFPVIAFGKTSFIISALLIGITINTHTNASKP